MVEKKGLGVGTFLATFVAVALTITLVMPSLVGALKRAEKARTTQQAPENLFKEIVMATDSTPTGTVIAIEEIGAGLMRATVDLDKPLDGKVNATYSGSFITQSAGVMGPLKPGDKAELKKFYFYNYILKDGSSNATRASETEWIIQRKISSMRW